MHDDQITNRSGNRPFEDILRASMSRRSVLKTSAGLSVAGFFGALAGNNLLAKVATAATAPASGLLGFTALKIADSVANPKVPSISPEYQYSILIPWGTSIQPGGPEYTGNPNTRPSSTQQANPHLVGLLCGRGAGVGCSSSGWSWCHTVILKDSVKC